MESPLYKTAPASVLVIETLRYDPAEGFLRLGLHMDRAEKTCDLLGFSFDRGACLMALGEAVADAPVRCRLTIDREGSATVTTGEYTPIESVWKVAVSDVRLQSDDPWLQVKTTQRALYDDVRNALPKGVDEVIFLNERDEVCEGTITSIFAQNGAGLNTPPIKSGVLPGILRQEMIETNGAAEELVYLDDLKKGFYLGNSLRGLIKAELV